MKTKFFPNWLRLMTMFIMVLATLAPVGSAYAATCTVTTDADSGAGSLRIAVDNSGCTTIYFDGDHTIRLASPLELRIGRNPLTIDGAGHAVTISGDTDGDGTANVRVFIVRQTVTLTLNHVTVTSGSNGLYSEGTLNISNSTFSANSGGEGGGLYINWGTVTIRNSTIAGNTASSFGGGIYNWSGNVTLINSTLSGNTASRQGGGIYSAFGTVTFRNSIIANNGTIVNCWNGGTTNWVDGGGNLQYGGSDPDSCGTTITQADPMLDGLADNGGPTQTMALQANSPAIDAAVAANCPATDQRGVARPQGTHCDIGAYEYEVTPIDSTPPVITSQIAGTLGQSGWYVGDVTLSWTVVDEESDITSTSGCDPVSITSDQPETAYTCTATSAGGTSSETVSIKRDATAPSISVTPDRAADHGGWYNHAVNFTVSGSDEPSGIASCIAPFGYSGPDNAAASVSGVCTDQAGNVGNGSFSFQYDATAPSVTITPDRAADHGGWYNHAVNFTVSGSDEPSGIASCIAPFGYSGPDNAAASVSGVCTDQAGNVGNGSFSFQYDATAPSVTVTPDREADHDGWYNHAVNFMVSGSDAPSSIASCTAPFSYSGPDNAAVSVSGICTDQAGNVGNGSFAFQFDATPPVVAVTGVTEGSTYILGAVPKAACSTTDEGSGVATEATLSLSGGNALGVGSFTATCSGALDNASNAAEPVSVQYNVTFLFTGFSSPVDNPSVMNIAKAGQTIPLKFRITDANGNPITNLTGVTVTAVSLSCSAGTTTDLIEEYAAGNSGLQNLGNGYYQWNWKTPTTYANSCKTMKLNLGEGAGYEHIALFQFRK